MRILPHVNDAQTTHDFIQKPLNTMAKHWDLMPLTCSKGHTKLFLPLEGAPSRDIAKTNDSLLWPGEHLRPACRLGRLARAILTAPSIQNGASVGVLDPERINGHTFAMDNADRRPLEGLKT